MTVLTAPISAETFQAAKEFVKAVLIERDPTLDLADGSAISGLVVENEAQMAAVHDANFDALNKSFSLQAIADNLVDVDDAKVDSLISNYYITRRQASPASGPVRVVVNLNTTYVIPQGYMFGAHGVTYQTADFIRVLRAGSGVAETSTQKILIPRADGKYEFTVPVTATSPGSAGLISAGTALTITAPIDGMETAMAATDFTGGQNTETTAELLARAQDGVTAKTFGGPDHIQAALNAQFAGIKTAVIGIGSGLMTRDRGNVFGTSQGAKEDIWCKTSAFPVQKTLRVTATAATTGRQRAFTISNPDSAGIYRVQFIRPINTPGAQGDVPVNVVPLKRQDLLFTPRTLKTSDLNYSGIVDLRVVFTDTTLNTDVPAGSSAEYDVDVLYMPSIDAVGNYAYSLGVRPSGTDVYVRAGIPCMIGVSLEIQIPPGGVSPVIAEVQTAVSNAINALNFGVARLSPYTIYTAVSPLIASGEVADVVLNATILAPDLTNVVLTNASFITIPTDYIKGFSPLNTFFTCPPANVGVTIVSR